jgi:ankyrin repeat protein
MKPTDDSSISLIQAVLEENLEAVQLLLRAGETPDSQQHSQQTPLQIAARQGNLAIVKTLIEAGAKIDLGWDYPPIYEAISNGHLEVVRELISAGTDINCALDEDDNTILLEAVSHGHLDIVMLLVESGADVDVQGESGTPLIEAVEGGHRAIYEFLYPLVSNRETRLWADTHAHSRFKITEEQNRKRQDRLVEELVESASLGDLEKIQALLLKNVQVNSANSEGQTALNAAAVAGHLQLVKFLLSVGADANLFDNHEDESNFETPLMSLVRTKHPNRLEIMKCLIQGGANPNLKNSDGFTAIVYALDCPGTPKDIEDGIKALINAGADINTSDNRGMSLLGHAKMRKMIRLASYLELIGART